ncbi:3-oxoacyl-[acyl-carrier-protein] reductase [Halanaerobium hydrogeniformans]|uniref:3-oxoacyl-[acyl-carrier-protein] reductase n=1 Tax=Halanaerobium hydrogeniformans TaxID=656519 RepID=E4RLR1_HALHG|nr:3-oxoacyl-[acyl-carrier-protein] reductase [Halanaerobium hydrogeniformans]ADQ14975.1 3-oxoacyl-(acyl-carrier-protein) reductase [Halanaerobium hydrogeniformans]
MIDLKNKKVLISGSSRGIGAEIAIKLADLGADVIINYASSEDKANELRDSIKESGGNAYVIQADISDFDQAAELVKKAYKTLGGLDVLVNNAGITRDKLLLRMKEEDWDKVMDINLKGTFNCTKNAVRYLLKADNGKIINISSVIGLIGNPGQANYSAAKAGMIGFTKTLAKELASKGVCSNAIAPGFIETEMTDELKDSIKDDIINRVPLARFGRAEEVADLVAFLASDKANYINGQVISIDGGMSLG